MSKKCTEVDHLVEELAEAQKEDQLNYERIDNANSGWYNQATGGKSFKQALGDFINNKTNKGLTKLKRDERTPREAYVAQEKEIQKLVNKHFKTTDNKEKAMLITKLNSLMYSDEFFELMLNDIAMEMATKYDMETLASVGEPIISDPTSGKIDISTLPLDAVRVLNGYVGQALGGEEFVMSKLSTRLMFEWYLPKTIVRRSRSAPMYKYMEKMMSYRNRAKALSNTFMRALSMERLGEKTIVDETMETLKIRKFENLKRHQAGLQDYLDHITDRYAMFNQGGNTQFQTPEEMWKFVDDFRRGKVFFRIDPDGFGEFYMFDQDRPSPKMGKNGKFETYENGQIQFDWKTKSWNKEQLAKLKEKKELAPSAFGLGYVLPYKTENGKHLKLSKEDAREFDALMHMYDGMFEEIIDTMTPLYLNQYDRIDKIQQAYPRFEKGLPQVIKIIHARITSLEKELRESGLEANRVKASDVLQEIRSVGKKEYENTHYLEDGSIIKVKQYRRYQPSQMHMAQIPQALEEGRDRMQAEVDGLRIAAEFDEDGASPEERMSMIDNINVYETHIAGLTKALYDYDYNERMIETDEDYDAFRLPWNSTFESVQNFIPAKYRRTDKNLYTNYLKSMVKNYSHLELMVDLLEAHMQEKNPALQEYMTNRFLVATGNIHAKGRFMGKASSTFSQAQFLSKATGGYVDPHRIRKLVLGAKQWQVGSTLSGITQGAEQLPSHFLKIANVGYDAWVTAMVDAQTPENQKLMYDKGVFSFEDVIENMMIGLADDADQEVYRTVIRDLKKELRNTKDGNLKARLQNRLKKVKQTPQITFLQEYVNWALSGKVSIYKTDSIPLKLFKSALGAMNPISISVTERHLRGVSYMIGVNQAVRMGHKRDSAFAHKMGVEFMNKTDMYLGAEGVGDRFGNDILQWANSLSIWSTQRFGYDIQSLKQLGYALTPTNLPKGQGYAKMMYDITRYSALQLTGPASVVGGAIGAVAMAPDLGVLANMVAIGAGGTAGWKAQDYLGVGTTQRTAMRKSRPIVAGGIQELIMNVGMSSLIGAVLYSDILTKSGLVTSVMMKKVIDGMRGANSRMGSGGFVSALGSPYWRTIIASILLGYAISDEDERKDLYDDINNLVRSVGGMGYSTLLALMYMFVEEEDNIATKQEYSRKRTAKDDAADLLFGVEAINQFSSFGLEGEFPLVGKVKIQKTQDYVKDAFEETNRLIDRATAKVPDMKN